MKDIKKIAQGQKILIFSILAYFLIVGLEVYFIGSPSFFSLAPLATGAYGVFQSLSGMRVNIFVRIILIALLLLPVISLFVLLGVSLRSTKILKESGYKVGFFGAKNKAIPASA